MGNCCTNAQNQSTAQIIKSQLINSIDNQDTKAFIRIVNAYTKQGSQFSLNINDPLLKLQGIPVTPLAYAIRMGATQIVKFLHEQKEASMAEVGKAFSQAGKRAIDIICENGHLELLKYFLPIHRAGLDIFEEQQYEDSSEMLSIFAQKQTRSHASNQDKYTGTGTGYSPIQRACDRGFKNIVQFLFEKYQHEEPPKEFDVHWVELHSGENCALISVKNADLAMIKFLHTTCQANFNIKTKNNEAALQIAVAGSKRRPQLPYLDCIRYLVEVVKVDPTYEYEDLLLVCENHKILGYLEVKLKERGIYENKGMIEQKYQIGNDRAGPQVPTSLQARLDAVKGSDFNFQELFQEELKQDDESNISSITPLPVRSLSPFDMPSALDINLSDQN